MADLSCRGRGPQYVIVRGLYADRHIKLLIHFGAKGAFLNAYATISIWRRELSQQS
jgi:hypothetical protein